MSNNQPPKEDLRPQYASFLRTEAGKDFLRQMEILEKAFILQGIKGKTNAEKANSLSRLEGMIAIRDYVLRMSKKG